MQSTTHNGVPFVARRAHHPGAPVIAVWHLLDPPNTPAAMAAALPLAGLDANIVYLGLPLTGARAEHSGFEEFLASGLDMVTEYFGPMRERAVAEFPDALADVSARLSLPAGSPLGVLGGSAGASTAAEVAVVHSAEAVVLVNPMLRLRPMVDAMAEFLPAPYAWSPAADTVAARMDFVARAQELARSPVLVIEGADDEPPFLDAAREFESLAIGDVRYVDGAQHPLAEWPGTDPAPQTDAAKAYDALASAFFRQVFGL